MKIVRKRDKQFLKSGLIVLAGYIRATFDREKNAELFNIQMDIIREIAHRFGVDDIELNDPF